MKRKTLRTYTIIWYLKRPMINHAYMFDLYMSLMIHFTTKPPFFTEPWWFYALSLLSSLMKRKEFEKRNIGLFRTSLSHPRCVHNTPPHRFLRYFVNAACTLSDLCNMLGVCVCKIMITGSVCTKHFVFDRILFPKKEMIDLISCQAKKCTCQWWVTVLLRCY